MVTDFYAAYKKMENSLSGLSNLQKAKIVLDSISIGYKSSLNTLAQINETVDKARRDRNSKKMLK